MLKLALLTAKSQHEFFTSTAEKVELPEVKALLLVLADEEYKMIAKIQHMIATGILDEIEELKTVDDRDEIPDPTPFDPFREDSDPRIFICNKSLEKTLKSYKLYLHFATKAKTEVVSLLFEYLAYLKMHQINKLRKICRTF